MKFANLAIAVTAAGALSACASASTAASRSDVPKLEVPPLSMAGFTGKPCRVFGVDQLGSLGITAPGAPDPEQFTARCRWTDGKATTIGISLFGESQGLARVYAAKEAFPYFKPTEVAAYPAVDRDTAQGTTGTCSTVVGIADGAAFEIEVDVDDQASADYTAPCAVSKHVAEIALANIKGGG
ncbi:DUF3558 family protein [Umezawaea sp.]|uniref:DUF3558 family protein n=1 Tax=Umezawaea sp. TaxID=1955258 RepID=UPI002ED569AD